MNDQVSNLNMDDLDLDGGEIGGTVVWEPLPGNLVGADGVEGIQEILVDGSLKSGDHQLRLVASPIICRVFTSQVVQDFSHQQYDGLYEVLTCEKGTICFCRVRC